MPDHPSPAGAPIGRERPGADQLSDLLGRAPSLRAADAEPAPAPEPATDEAPSGPRPGAPLHIGGGGGRGPRRAGRSTGTTEGAHTQANATHPRLLWRLARTAAKAGLGVGPDGALPVQRYVQKQEQAAMATQLRAASRLVAGVVGRVMRLEAELRGAEGRLHDAGVHLDELTEHHRAAHTAVAKRRAAALEQLEPSPPATLKRRAPLLGSFTGRVTLGCIAAGQAGLAWAAAGSTGLGAALIAPLTLAVGAGTAVAAHIGARSLDQIAITPGGMEHPRRRRRLDLSVGGGAFVAGTLLAVAAAQLRTAVPAAGAGEPLALSWLALMGAALLGLAVTVAYAAVPADPGLAARRRRAVVQLGAEWLAERRRRSELKAAVAERRAARRALDRLQGELAEQAGRLGQAEVDGVQAWRQQAAIGDAAQFALEEHLLEFTTRRRRSIGARIAGRWRGRTPATFGPSRSFNSTGEAQADWPEQVAKLTRPAREVLVRRGLVAGEEPRPPVRPETPAPASIARRAAERPKPRQTARASRP
jgi:hypothetical protein